MHKKIYTRNYNPLLNTNPCPWLTIHKDRILWKRPHENKGMVLKNGVKICKPRLIMACIVHRAMNLLITIYFCSFKSLLWCDTTNDILTSSQEGLVCHSKAQSTFCKNCQFCSITWVTFKTTNFATQCFHEELIINFHGFLSKRLQKYF